MNLSRRGFLAGLLATACVAALGVNSAPYDMSGGWSVYTSTFKWGGFTVKDWRYVTRVCNIAIPDDMPVEYSGFDWSRADPRVSLVARV